MVIVIVIPFYYIYFIHKERVFASIEPSKPKQAKTDNNKEKSDIEENPKWTVVSEILEEIKVKISFGYL